jgi:hypothetical protein
MPDARNAPQALPAAVLYDEGVSRSLYFNVHALPALAHYRTVEWLHRDASDEEQKRILQPLHERCALALGVAYRTQTVCAVIASSATSAAQQRQSLRC